MKRVLIIMNKWWECDPVMNVIVHAYAIPKMLGWPVSLNHPRKRPAAPLPLDPAPKPRAVFQLAHVTVEAWCISDLLEHLPEGKQQSSSERKAERLPLIFSGAVPDLVIAVGTAALPSDKTENGSVVIGTGIFMHNGHPGGTNTDSNWTAGPFDQLLPSALDAAKFSEFTKVDNSATDRFLPPPLNAAAKPNILAQHDHVALGSVNVTDSAEYAKLDPLVLEAFADSGAPGKAMSMETTHGLIRAQSSAPFLFVSGIANRLGHFADEVVPRSYAQNFAAAHNAGVAVAWMLPNIDAAL